MLGLDLPLYFPVPTDTMHWNGSSGHNRRASWMAMEQGLFVRRPPSYDIASKKKNCHVRIKCSIGVSCVCFFKELFFLQFGGTSNLRERSTVSQSGCKSSGDGVGWVTSYEPLWRRYWFYRNWGISLPLLYKGSVLVHLNMSQRIFFWTIWFPRSTSTNRPISIY